MALPHPNSFFTVALLATLTALTGCERRTADTPSRVKTEDLPALPEAIKPKKIPRSVEQEPKNLTLAVVGEVRGELEPCGCPTLPFGGFERRDTLLKNLKEEGPGPVFHVDAGDMLIKGFSTRRIDDVQDRAREMLRMSSLVGVDVWVPGTSDLMALSLEELKRYKGPPMVSATWKNSAGKHVLPTSIVLKKAGLEVAVIGISNAPPEESGLLLEEPHIAVTAALKTIPDSVDWVIGVGNINEEKARELMASVSGLSAFFTTKGAVYNDPPDSNTSRTIIETPDRGRYMQVVHARLATDPNEPLLLHPEKAEWRARLSAVRRGEDDALSTVGAGRNLGLVNTIPLSAELDQEGAVADRLKDYQKTRRKQAAQRAEEITPHQKVYASSGTCVNCHSSEFARWTLTGHARSWRALLERNATQNPECVACHTTGFGEPGGLGELTKTNIRKFKGVQCEECHGPMKGHPADARVLSEPVSKTTCLKCHDEANSPNFVYEQYLPQASCQGGSPSILPAPPEAP